MYITLPEYAAIYGSVDEMVFVRFEHEARMHMDRLTTGLGGIKKLKIYFPTDEDDAATVKHCAAAVIRFLCQIHEAEQSASLGRGYEETANGLRGKVISSVSAGNESISYSTASQKTALDAAVADPAEKSRMIENIVREYLSGVSDSNGVNLLYMGPYPHRR